MGDSKMRTMGMVMAFALVFVAGVAVAEVKWEQLPIDGIALWSQYDQCEAWTAEAADDFECYDGTIITAVEWWGIHVPAVGATPTSFMIRFYSDIPDPDPADPADWSQPGDLLYEEECLFFTEDWEEQYQQYHYSQELPQPFEQVAGTIYWISVQAIVCMPDLGWAWCECDPVYHWNDEAVWRSENPDPNWYFPNWTPVSVYTAGAYDRADLSFRLISEPGSPVEESSWGNIKALFR